MTDSQTWYAIAIIALVTAALRFIPFLLLGENRKTPYIVQKLGKILPYAIMGMLVVYCLKGVNFTGAAGYIPSLIGCLVVGILYVWKRNTLVSIVAGTVCYMLLVQSVF